MSKPSVPKGTRDFLPDQAIKRRYIFSVIEDVFQRYGYRPIETPALENLTTLTGKYGEEGDRLLFKVLNNGDYLAKADKKALEELDSNAFTPSIAKRGLRYDLTVPFARFVTMHQNDLALPFKRYQIQPVWRADRPQKGRYQEFYQCDVDVVGSSSLVYEAELIHIYDEVFARLGLPVIIQVNNRKVLAAIAEVSGVQDKMMEMTISVDKLDKIGWDKVIEEMERRGITTSQGEKIKSLFTSTWEEVKAVISGTEIGKQGVDEMERILHLAGMKKLVNEVKLDLTLARGLNYYTGCIFEVKAVDAAMGSIGGGGRYDDLTSVFGLKDVSGVGISFGAERIYDVLEEKNLFPESLQTDIKVLFCPMDDASLDRCFEWVMKLRDSGMSCDVYPEAAKMKKQLKHADARDLTWVAIMGTEEFAENVVVLKNMKEGTQEKVSFDALLERLS
jgi:histidyl-tRNA synthetase